MTTIKEPLHFIIVDDDPINNFICKKVIKGAVEDALAKDFTEPEAALRYLKTVEEESLILLDINMPTMTGWEFLEKYNELDEHIKKLFTIYILSSSVDLRDKEKAAANKNVKEYIVKPLSKENLASILAKS
jgi:response regulator RpfG family c-di-GMP phosphodiesterase